MTAPGDGSAVLPPSTALARTVVTALVAAGVREVVLCAGSRSAPLAYALHAAEASGWLRLHVRHDERSAAFTALGVGEVGGLAAVVTTSGSAVANLAPAALEADEAGVPLLLVTADRPAALRGTWANQTSAHQAGIFGPVVRAVLEVDADHADPAAVVAAAAATARGGRERGGPVHLDVAFADPLVPEQPWEPGPAPARGATAGEPDGPDAPDGPPVALVAGPRTVVLAGHGARAGARELAERAGWPLLAEPSSGARSGPCAVPAYRLLLGGAAPHLVAGIERVVAFGRPTLSRPVTALLARTDVDLVHVRPHDDDPGPADRERLVRVRAVQAPAAPEGAGFPSTPPSSGWLDAWLRAGRAAAGAVGRAAGPAGAPAGGAVLTGLAVAAAVAATTSEDQVLVCAASNPVRDVDLAAAPWERHPLAVLSNRGVSGIDGTVSTACGAALATGALVRVLVGDLAFLHDLNALLLPVAEVVPHVQVVVADDDGGGIFSGLEHGEPSREATFERLFGTPHGSDVAALCSGYGASCREVTSPEGLSAALSAPAPGLSVVLVRTDRSALRERAAAIAADAARACSAAPAIPSRPGGSPPGPPRGLSPEGRPRRGRPG